MKKLLMTVSIKRVAGQPDELKADLQAEADFPDDASVECMKEQLDEFKQLAAHCAKDLVGNHTPQRVIPASSDAAVPIEEPPKSETMKPNPSADSNQGFHPILVEASYGASTPKSNPETKNQNSNSGKPATPSQINMVHAIIRKQNLDKNKILRDLRINDLNEITHKQVNQFKEKYDPEPSFR
ncbi:MAG: hypothetical protein GX937_12270 [Lentisphaerae bacterium]|jgi:hypothetical protein|nr:hypothetical protein [Lentisphaerota bacterium]